VKGILTPEDTVGVEFELWAGMERSWGRGLKVKPAMKWLTGSRDSDMLIFKLR
jgi:hypothetical protein